MQLSFNSRRIAALIIVVACVLASNASRALAVGWGPTDFIIGGGDADHGGRLGVFDANLNLKGYLANPIIYGLDDFDGAGRIVGRDGSDGITRFDALGNSSVVFSRHDGAFSGARKLNVTANGDYLMPQRAIVPGFQGVQEFDQTGNIVRQFGSGICNQLAVLPGNRAWAWFPFDGRDVIRVLDLTSGMQAGTLTLSGIAPNSMRFSKSTNTVLVSSIQAFAVYDIGLDGSILHTFAAPTDSDLADVTRGPNDDVYALGTHNRILHWRADGTYLGATSTTATIGQPSEILWAGNVPEPSSGVLIVVGVMPFLYRGMARHRQ